MIIFREPCYDSPKIVYYLTTLFYTIPKLFFVFYYYYFTGAVIMLRDTKCSTVNHLRESMKDDIEWFEDHIGEENKVWRLCCFVDRYETIGSLIFLNYFNKKYIPAIMLKYDSCAVAQGSFKKNIIDYYNRLK